MNTDTFYTETKKKVISILKRYDFTEYTTQELTQETYLAFYQAAQKREIENPSFYILTIAHNVAKMHIKKKSALKRKVQLTHYQGREEIIKDTKNTPEDTLLEKEKTQVMKEIYEELDKDTREILDLFHVQCLTLKEISALKKRKIPSIKSRLSRGRRKLKKQLALYLEQV